MIGYELPPFRPPSEARSLLLRATRGCPWHRCAFCIMYTDTKFEVRSVEEVKQDIASMKKLADLIREWAGQAGCGDSLGDVAQANGILWLGNDGVKTAFIGDSNSIVMRTGDLAEIIRALYDAFPTLERVTSYGRAKTVLRKTDEDLAELKRAGLTRLHLGLESGDDAILEYINKGVTSEEMIEAGQKVVRAGISLSEYVILGIGGKDRWRQHAEATARVLNAIDPDFIRVRTLMLLPDTPLRQRFDEGEFKTSSPEEVLLETRRLLELLEVNSEFVSDHVSNYLDLNGKLPGDKGRLLRQIDSVLALPVDQRPASLRPEMARHI